MEEENRIISFLRKQGSKLLLLVLAIACVIAWTERLMKKRDSSNWQDFILASRVYERFLKGEVLSETEMESAENVIKRHKELSLKYEPMLALVNLAKGNKDASLNYSSSVLKRRSKELPPLYRSYAENTLLIAQEKYDEAYAQSLSLAAQLEKDQTRSMLEGMNTLRLFFLACHLKDGKQQLFFDKLRAHPCYDKIEPLFTAGQVKLQDYATH